MLMYSDKFVFKHHWVVVCGYKKVNKKHIVKTNNIDFKLHSKEKGYQYAIFDY